MYRYFEDEIKEVNQTLINMSIYVEEMIYNSIISLKTLDTELAKKVIEFDDEIDKMEIEIDEKCTEIILRHHPLAVDLRFIIATLKINNDLERIADLATDICWRVIEIKGIENHFETKLIEEMGYKVKDMLKNAVKSLTERDHNSAKELIFFDREIDKLRNEITDRIVKDYLIKDERISKKALALILIARHLERIADHCVNIAEDVIYITDAKIVKHRNETL